MELCREINILFEAVARARSDIDIVTKEIAKVKQSYFRI
jgi:hypothetical protein